MLIKPLEKGEYKVNIKITAKEDTVCSVYINHRRFAANKIVLKKGETRKLSLAAAVRYAVFQKKQCYDDDFLEITATGEVEISAEAERAEVPALYLLGDSTVCDQTEFGESEFSTYCGWGQTLPMYLGNKAAVSNHAEQGTAATDCLAFHFEPVEKALRPIDTVVMQFGHNDQKIEGMTPEKYADNLIRICERVYAKGARAVICSPINRLIYIGGKLNEYLLQYAIAAKEAAKRCKAGFIDLHGETSGLYEKMGKEAESLFCRRETLDTTHPNDIGAMVMGKYVCNELERIFG